jgi:hypothetical protein
MGPTEPPAAKRTRPASERAQGSHPPGGRFIITYPPPLSRTCYRRHAPPPPHRRQTHTCTCHAHCRCTQVTRQRTRALLPILHRRQCRSSTSSGQAILTIRPWTAHSRRYSWTLQDVLARQSMGPHTRGRSLSIQVRICTEAQKRSHWRLAKMCRHRRSHIRLQMRRRAQSTEGERPSVVNDVRTELPTTKLLDPTGSD